MEPPGSIVLQLPHPNRSEEDSDQCHSVQAQLAQRQLGERQLLERVLGEQDKEGGDRSNGRCEDNDAQEESLVTLTTVKGLETARDGRVLLEDTDRSGRVASHIAPHEVQDDSADQSVLDAAREEVRGRHLYQLSNEIRPGTIRHHLLPFKVPSTHVPLHFAAERFRCPHGDVLHLTTVRELVVGLVDEHVDPQGEICADQMHQANASDQFEGVEGDFLQNIRDVGNR